MSMLILNNELCQAQLTREFYFIFSFSQYWWKAGENDLRDTKIEFDNKSEMIFKSDNHNATKALKGKKAGLLHKNNALYYRISVGVCFNYLL